MKFGIRIPSLKRRIAARTSIKRHLRHSVGLKMPSGTGWIFNPKKWLYNKIYNKVTISPEKLVAKATNTKQKTITKNIHDAVSAIMLGGIALTIVSFFVVIMLG